MSGAVCVRCTGRVVEVDVDHLAGEVCWIGAGFPTCTAFVAIAVGVVAISAEALCASVGALSALAGFTGRVGGGIHTCAIDAIFACRALDLTRALFFATSPTVTQLVGGASWITWGFWGAATGEAIFTIWTGASDTTWIAFCDTQEAACDRFVTLFACGTSCVGWVTWCCADLFAFPARTEQVVLTSIGLTGLAFFFAVVFVEADPTTTACLATHFVGWTLWREGKTFDTTDTLCACAVFFVTEECALALCDAGFTRETFTDTGVSDTLASRADRLGRVRTV